MPAHGFGPAAGKLAPSGIPLGEPDENQITMLAAGASVQWPATMKTVGDMSVPEQRQSGTPAAFFATINPTYGCPSPSGVPFVIAPAGTMPMASAAARVAASANSFRTLRLPCLEAVRPTRTTDSIYPVRATRKPG